MTETANHAKWQKLTEAELRDLVEALEQENALLRTELEQAKRYGQQEYRIELLLREDLQKMFKENASLKAQLARYERAVTDEEWSQEQVAHLSYPALAPARKATRAQVDAIISRRTAGPK